MHSRMFTPSLHTHTPYTHKYYFKISHRTLQGARYLQDFRVGRNIQTRLGRKQQRGRCTRAQVTGCRNSPQGKKACVHMSCGLCCPCPRQCPVHNTCSMADTALQPTRSTQNPGFLMPYQHICFLPFFDSALPMV